MAATSYPNKDKIFQFFQRRISLERRIFPLTPFRMRRVQDIGLRLAHTAFLSITKNVGCSLPTVEQKKMGETVGLRTSTRGDRRGGERDGGEEEGDHSSVQKEDLIL
jgi:hypothetical protein